MAYKLLVPVIIIALALLLACVLIYWCTLKLDFSQVFKASAKPNTGGLSATFQGVDGGSMKVNLKSHAPESSSEELIVTEKNLNEIKSSLNRLELEQLELFTSLPSSIFRFDVILSSYPDSPNKAKKASYYSVTDSNEVTRKVLPGEKIILANKSKIGDLSEMLSKIKIKLVYSGGLNQEFYDPNGEFVSQATGELIIRPTNFVQMLIIFGAWAFIVAILVLIKQTLMSSQDLKTVIDLFKNNV